MRTPVELHCLRTVEETARSAAEFIAGISEDRVRRRGCFSIALSGGTTPISLFEALTSPPISDRIAWDRWQVFWGDERMVPPDHPASNYRMAKEALLDKVPINPDLVFRMAGEKEPQEAAQEYEEALCTTLHFARQSFDLVLLGLGEDGHTASLFPGTEALNELRRLVVANWVPELGSHRLTFTLPLINAAKYIVYYVTGSAKARAVQAVMTAPLTTEAELLPPAAMIHAAIGLHWFLDAQAACLLEEVLREQGLQRQPA